MAIRSQIKRRVLAKTTFTAAIISLLLISTLCLTERAFSQYSDRVTYTYDKLNRLTSTIYSSGPSIIYVYDAAGNRTSLQVSGGSSIPVIINVSPNTVKAGTAGITVSVNGSNFVNNSIVQWNGANRPTTFISSAQLNASIPVSDLVAAGTFNLSVVSPGGHTSNAVAFTVTDTVSTPTPTPTVSPTPVAATAVQFASATYGVSEDSMSAQIMVSRTGNLSGTSSVVYATVDATDPIPCDPTLRGADGNLFPQGKAFARCDYATTIDTLTFGPGEFTKTFTVPLIDDAHSEVSETLQLRLSNPTGATSGSANVASLVIQDNDTGTGLNPIYTTAFFVRMQYLDFLSREPEAGEPWSAVLNKCPNIDADPSCDRILVSQSFFGSPEFRLKGFYVFNFYRVAFNRRPTYEEVITDMRSVTGATSQEVYQKRAAFSSVFIGRAEFKGLYDALGNVSFVNTLMDRYQLQQITSPDPANPEGGAKLVLTRASLIDRLGASGAQSLTRTQVLRAVVESNEVGAAEYNGAFVAMQYYGYLRRTPEESGYQAWLRVINQDPNNVRVMVNGFMNSTEYRLRFGRP